MIDSWEPYRLLANGMPSDEFEPEIRELVGSIPRLRTQADVVSAISSVFSRWFEPTEFKTEDCGDVGRELYDLLVQEGFIAAVPDNKPVHLTSARGRR